MRAESSICKRNICMQMKEKSSERNQLKVKVDWKTITLKKQDFLPTWGLWQIINNKGGEKVENGMKVTKGTRKKRRCRPEKWMEEIHKDLNDHKDWRKHANNRKSWIQTNKTKDLKGPQS